jgi:molybdopterin synthase catalytic subunit
MIRARLLTTGFAPAELLSNFLETIGDEDGAVTSFVGLARSRSKDGAAIEGLFLEHHPRLTEASLIEIAEAAAARFPVSAVEVVHRAGHIRPKEPIVWVAAASAHRRAAFEAADYLMDRLKTEAVFWKREEGPSGSSWIEPTEKDYADRGRWE